MTKTGHMIRVDDEVWAALIEMAAAWGYVYRGRPNPGRVVEDLVRGAPEPASVDAAAAPLAQPSYRLADVVARWPAKTQVQWQQEEWKAGRWVKLVLDTINGN